MDEHIERAVGCVLDPARPITPQLHRFLRLRIIRNDLKPGDRLSEAEIARSCAVSRQPVREAFIKLSEQGLLSILPQRGSLVTTIAISSVLDARFVREAIEADIVRLLARRPDPALIARLRAQIDRQAAVAETAPRDFIQLDETFHRTLAEGAGKTGAWKLLEGLKSQMDRVRFLALGRFPVDKLIAQHTAIVDGIAAGDMAAAEAATRAHLREILNDLPAIAAENPGFFDGLFESAAGEPDPLTDVTGGDPT
ncbi:GntR family transcriptional regulator [Rhodovulum sp. BSW8]|uniref:GntR family transcriptional regulator n=1 Tax=Rhodovulum visakhapatnamense TaxID=364297 RepID=A0A4R8FZ93_9RHOB|nr:MULTISPECIES: GntR family transcriptional regulator [Rhodovulum]OLS45066.1 GntR family transcriptional regulator [Rhodovulum sulfidophilum]MBL3571215.1 GntR family transcriptional regulator [Rhodovulum visakhapatnamense]MBL3579102.1 GntR family transcriptional regulator [Rhodovulum visakhapatnamense]RBO52754.1 GntR family transcriptional regulator [Rhodovulum sp. BSW8]TDX32433.1 DNA-binding GntR family transcriptional regulator [Rhodovulum visakhapatnamense]